VLPQFELQLHVEKCPNTVSGNLDYPPSLQFAACGDVPKYALAIKFDVFSFACRKNYLRAGLQLSVS
jgi:hypothetical protein